MTAVQHDTRVRFDVNEHVANMFSPMINSCALNSTIRIVLDHVTLGDATF